MTKKIFFEPWWLTVKKRRSKIKKEKVARKKEKVARRRSRIAKEPPKPKRMIRL